VPPDAAAPAATAADAGPVPEAAPAATAAPAAADPLQLLRSRNYVVLMLLGALIGAPVAFVAYFFLKFVSEAQHFVFSTAPKDLGLNPVPNWWVMVPLVLSGLLVALTITYLPGIGGHKPAEGFKSGGTVAPIELPGIILAALASLCLGAVVGPEAPLIAIGGGLGVLAVHLVKKDAPPMAAMVIGAAGSFAAIATLLGSPLVGAFLLMEAAGFGGPLLGVLLVPGLLAAGFGSLIFVGLDNWTGYGTFSLSLGAVPPAASPTGVEFLWAIGIGLVAAVLGSLISRGGLLLQPIVERRKILLTPVAGLAVALLAIAFAQATGKAPSFVLFSGQSALPGLVQHAAAWSAGALTLLVLCKGAAYGISLSGFRGGPIFPAIFLGGAGGIALSHLPGLPMIAGVAMGIGAVTVAMLGLPLVSALLAGLLVADDAVHLMPLIIVAVAVSYVASAWLKPPPVTATA
jgi:H+/Cl- antiporter ClcA